MHLKLKQQSGNQITLQSMIDVNAAFNSILKESYRKISGKSTSARIPEFKVYVSEVKKGSIIEMLSLEVTDLPKIAGQTAFVLSQFKADDVFKVAQNSLQFLIDLAKARKDGKVINIKIEEGSLAIVNLGNGNISVGDVIFETAKTISRPAKMLTRPIKNGNLESVQIGNKHAILSLNSANAESFEDVIEVDETTREIVGNIIGFNKNTRVGTVKFIEELTEKTLNFELTSKSFIIDTIEFMKHRQCRLLCHDEYIPGPNGQKTVVSLQVIKIKEI